MFLKPSSPIGLGLLALIGGFFYALGFPLFNQHSLFIGPIIGFAILNFVIRKSASLKIQLFFAFCYSLGFYLLGFYWIPYTLKEFGGLNFPLNYLLGLIFSIFVIPQVYIFTVLQNKTKNPIALSLLYVLLEAFIPQQFPAHLGHSFLSLAPNIPLKLAPYLGAPIYSFLSALIALTFLETFIAKKKSPLIYLFISLMVILNFTLPSYGQKQAFEKINLRIVQPNIGNFLKITSEKGEINSLKNVFDRYDELSTAPTRESLDLIIWPETAFPTLMSSDLFIKNADLKIPEPLSNIISKTKAELFIGGYDLKPSTGGDFESQYNAAFLFGNDQKFKNVYRKIHLIPFGEGLPFGPLNKYLSSVITNVSYFAAGDSYPFFVTKKNISFISVICYEVLFSDFVRTFLNHQEKQPQFIVNLTNDSWYGDTAEPYQHLFLAKWRSLEFNIPIVRSTNTGITTILLPDGSESKRLSIAEEKFIDLNLEIYSRDKTLYQRFGLWLVVSLALSLLAIEKLSKKLKP